MCYELVYEQYSQVEEPKGNVKPVSKRNLCSLGTWEDFFMAVEFYSTETGLWGRQG